MSRTGEAFDDTRVLFEGDSGALEPQRGPKLSAKAARIKARKDADAEAEADVDAAQDAAAEETADNVEANEAEKQTVAAAAARIKSEYDNAEAQSEVDTNAETAEAAETIEGEIVYEVEAADSKNATDSVESSDTDSAADDDIVDVDVVDAEVEQPQPTAPAQSAARPVTVELSDEDLDALEDGLDEDDDILLEDEPRKESPKASLDAEVSASESTVFTAPAAYELADDAYEMDETYVSAVDMMYPGAVDPDTEANADADADAMADTELTSAAEHNTDEDLEDGVAADANEGAVAEDVTHYEVNQEFEEDIVGADSDTELSEEELEFAQSRVGRGGWDPQADAENKATRYQRRQRTLMGLAVVVVLTVALGIIFGGWLWWTAAIAGGLTIAYLVALRTQVRQEQQLRARRISQLRRARLGVRSAQDEELAIPRYLRRPGAVIVEIDDSSPDWDHLPEMHEEVEEIPQRPAPRRIRRDDLAARRVG
ncbi:hypothetical protein C5Y44_03540 [Corynebacterium sp. J010B-136]|nr:hypothetical protein C5Y44_03540 [Corynebacterium sp. J010B-136]